MDENGARGSCAEFKVHYFVKSKDFRCFVDQNRIEDPEEAVVKVFSAPSQGVVSHDLVLGEQSGQFRVAPAESFSNSYNVFTLLSPPEARSIHPVAARAVKGLLSGKEYDANHTMVSIDRVVLP